MAYGQAVADQEDIGTSSPQAELAQNTDTCADRLLYEQAKQAYQEFVASEGQGLSLEEMKLKYARIL